MPAFIETICLNDGVPQHLDLHQARLKRTLHHLGTMPMPEHNLQLYIPSEVPQGRCKWRVVYSAFGVSSSEVSRYIPRPVQQLKLIEEPTLDYTYKSTDRHALELCFAQRGAADDVLITRHGLLTDTTIANVALFDGKCWYTPRQPLLAGVRRELLLVTGQLVKADIHYTELSNYTHIALFNALLPFGELLLPITNVQA